MTQAEKPLAYPFAEMDALEVDPRFAELRNGPLTRVVLPYGGEAWLATRHEDVKQVFADPRFSRAATIGQDKPRGTPAIDSSRMLLNLDPPDHTRIRKLIASAFTSRRIELLRVRAQEVVDELLDEMERQGPPADLVEGLSLPLPIVMICELLGVPAEDRFTFRGWSDTAMAVTAFSVEEITDAMQNLAVYMLGLVKQRESEPTDDILGLLVRAQQEGEDLTDEDVVTVALTLLTAGHETSANEISNFVYTLATHPEQFARLREDPSILPSAVNELLRYIPAGTSAGMPRIATEDTEVGGVLVRKDEAVFVVMASANRDEHAYPDPDALDLTRTISTPHVTFGHGVHYCIGAHLSRVELEVALGSLLHRFPDFDLAVPPEEVPWRRGRRVRGPSALPITWSTVRR